MNDKYKPTGLQRFYGNSFASRLGEKQRAGWESIHRAEECVIVRRVDNVRIHPYSTVR